MGAFSAALVSDAIRARLAKELDVDSRRLKTTLWGIDFPNPLGMAAGFDKDGRYFNALGALGFGHIEIGTVTGQGQAGNPKPRLFRLIQDQGLLNRMGFNNQGSQALAKRLEQSQIEPVLGINIGKSKVVPLESAAEDYGKSLRRLHTFAHYLVVNVSSPNTPGLRKLQGKEELQGLLGSLQERNESLGAASGRGRKPLLLKISPDLKAQALEDVVAVVEKEGVDGIIATNTTISRKGLKTANIEALGEGGVSGRPLAERSRQVLGTLYEMTDGKIPLIGVGGVFSAQDMWAMIEAGASLVQIWTAFIYEGPLIVRRILREFDQMLAREGLSSVQELVGRAHRAR